MKRILTTAIILIMCMSVEAQQDPQFTQWFNDKQSFNPAAVGIRNGNCLSGFFRNQWTGFDNQPTSVLLNYAGRIDRDNLKGGMGLTFYNDQLGQETNNIIRGMFAYHMDAGPGTLSAGLALGMYGKQLGADWLPPEGTGSIPLDNAINGTPTSDAGFDLNLGLYYFEQGKYYVGASMTHLTQSDLTDLSIKLQSHLYVMGGYNFDLGGSGTVLRTNMLAKSDLNKWALDLNANVMFNDMVYGGITWRPGDAIAPVIGLEYCTSTSSKTQNKNMCYRLGYSYDTTTSEIRNFSTGTHEIFLGICFDIQNIPMTNRHANPRFL